MFLRSSGWAVFFLLLGISGVEAETGAFFTWELLWTGSWYKTVKTEDGFPLGEELFSGGTLFNRGDFILGLPRYGLSFRFQGLDKRLLPPGEDGQGVNPALGLYHRASGSRFLFGVQSEYGLPARIRNVWLRSVPFMEYRTPSSRDLKNEISASDKSEASLYLALPPKAGFGAFVQTALDGDLNPALGGGIGLGDAGTGFRVEGFYTRRELLPRKAQSWFSQTPPLPERDFRIYALALTFNAPRAAFASDWAWSETFAFGRGVYGNFALRLGDTPWRFSLAADGAGERFAGRDGAPVGAAFRLAAKGERYWPRSGLLRFQGLFRSPALGEVFDRASFSAYFRPSAPSAAALKAGASPVRFSRFSLGLSRDARTAGKTLDALDALAGFKAGPVNAAVSGSLHCRSTPDGDGPPLGMPPVFGDFESLKVSGELGWNPGVLGMKTRLGYTARAEKDPLWDFSLNGSIRPGKWGRFALKIASPDFPEKWNYTLSWRLEKK
jgi:hypothetical protein